MEVIRKQMLRGRTRYLILTDPDPATGIARAVIADPQAQTVARVRSVPALFRSEVWQPLAGSDPALDDLVKSIPALRRYRGIEVRLHSGVSAWIRWRQWSSENADAQALLTETTGAMDVPKFELDGDYYLALQAVAVLGGRILDKPRSEYSAPDEGY